jgi:subtilisin-like proprotein convertase family protein
LVLHSRSGGGAKNLVKTYDATSTPALGGLIGEAVHGVWTLAVSDLAAADSGQLAKWELELGFATEDVVEVSEAPGILIPDNVAAGIEQTLAVAGAGTIGALKVSVDITHTFIGDLQVALVSPSGRVAVLHARAGGGADNLIATYASANVPLLQAMIGEPCAGAWRLRAADLDKVDTGKLNRWSLRIVRQATPPVPAAPLRKIAAGRTKALQKKKTTRLAQTRR